MHKTIEKFNLICKESITILNGMSVNYNNPPKDMFIVGGSTPIGLPYGTSYERPISAQFPILRYNTDDECLEVYNHINSNWIQYKNSNIYTTTEENMPSGHFVKKDEGYLAGNNQVSYLGNNSVCIGIKTDMDESEIGDDCYVIGTDLISRGDNNIIIGSDYRLYIQAPPFYNATCIGTYNIVKDDSVVIGTAIYGALRSKTIGYGLETYGSDNILLGKFISSDDDHDTIKIGADSDDDEVFIKMIADGHLVATNNSVDNIDNDYPKLKEGEYMFVTSTTSNIIKIVTRLDGEIYSKEIELEAF